MIKGFKMIKCAVIGEDTSKSKSPQIHNFIASFLSNFLTYEKVSINRRQFEKSILETICTFDGINVTIPYKQSVIPYLNSLDDGAKVIGAVNTIYRGVGYNTDGTGFMMMLSSNSIDVGKKDILIIGAGGASRAIAYYLIKAGARVFIYSRTYARSVELCEHIKGAKALRECQLTPYYAVINASGVSDVCPIDGKILASCEVAIDLIYEPEKTAFLYTAEEYKKQTINGLGMLFYQAYFAQCIFCQLKPDVQQASQLFNLYLRSLV